MANTLKQRVQVLREDPYCSLDPKDLMRGQLLLNKMFKVYKEIPEGEYTELDGKMSVTCEIDRITVTYQDINNNFGRIVTACWAYSREFENGVQFTHCEVLDQSIENGKVVGYVDTSYWDFMDGKGYNYLVKSEHLLSNDGETNCHRGIYFDDGTPYLVSLK